MKIGVGSDAVKDIVYIFFCDNSSFKIILSTCIYIYMHI